jgi:hypothetical protein
LTWSWFGCNHYTTTNLKTICDWFSPQSQIGPVCFRHLEGGMMVFSCVLALGGWMKKLLFWKI